MLLEEKTKPPYKFIKRKDKTIKLDILNTSVSQMNCSLLYMFCFLTFHEVRPILKVDGVPIVQNTSKH